MAIKLNQGDRKIVNGIERAYHGSFGNCEDFIRQVNEQEIEYALFSELRENKDGTFTGREKRVFYAHPVPACSIVFGSGSDSYMRGIKILNKDKGANC